MGANSLKPKHVQALVELWLNQQLSPGTIKNRMSCLRWWAEKVNKTECRVWLERLLRDTGPAVRIRRPARPKT